MIPAEFRSRRNRHVGGHFVGMPFCLRCGNRMEDRGKWQALGEWAVVRHFGCSALPLPVSAAEVVGQGLPRVAQVPDLNA